MNKPALPVLGVVLGLCLTGCPGLDGRPAGSNPALGHYAYPTDASNTAADDCPSGRRDGPAGASNDEHTADDITYAVRTPANYDPSILHPLLMVYAPAGTNRFRSERLTGLTFEATAAGFVVAYADARRLSLPVIAELGRIPRWIGERWCVDEKRVYMTGHSDGGTVSLALGLLDGKHIRPAGVAPSGAGMRHADLTTMQCPDRLPALILHGAEDRLFPGYGAEAAAWLATCHACRLEDALPEPDAHGCRAYHDCRTGVNVTYCEHDGEHSRWPALNSVLLSFFKELDAGQG